VKRLLDGPFRPVWEWDHRNRLGSELSCWVGGRLCRWSLHHDGFGFSWLEQYREATISNDGRDHVARYCSTGAVIAKGALRHCALAIQRHA
jgi:hypothetical protein